MFSSLSRVRLLPGMLSNLNILLTTSEKQCATTRVQRHTWSSVFTFSHIAARTCTLYSMCFVPWRPIITGSANRCVEDTTPWYADQLREQTSTLGGCSVGNIRFAPMKRRRGRRLSKNMSSFVDERWTSWKRGAIMKCLHSNIHVILT